MILWSGQGVGRNTLLLLNIKFSSLETMIRASLERWSIKHWKHDHYKAETMIINESKVWSSNVQKHDHGTFTTYPQRFFHTRWNLAVLNISLPFFYSEKWSGERVFDIILPQFICSALILRSPHTGYLFSWTDIRRILAVPIYVSGSRNDDQVSVCAFWMRLGWALTLAI